MQAAGFPPYKRFREFLIIMNNNLVYSNYAKCIHIDLISFITALNSGMKQVSNQSNPRGHSRLINSAN